MPRLTVSKDGVDFKEVELPENMSAEEGLKKAQAKDPAYKQYYHVVSPDGAENIIEATILDAAKQKGYTLRGEKPAAPPLVKVQPLAEGEEAPVSKPNKKTGPGSEAFLKSAVLQTVRGALPGVPEGVTAVYRKAENMLSGDEPKPFRKILSESSDDIKDFVAQSPEGKLAGDISGAILGAGTTLGAARKLGKAGQLAAESAYEMYAGTGEGLVEGESLGDAAKRGAMRVGLVNAPVGAVIGAKALGATAGTAGGYALGKLAKWGITDKDKREAIDLLTQPKGASVRQELSNRMGKLDTVMAEFTEAKKAGTVADLDDYYRQMKDSRKFLGEARDEIVGTLPKVEVPKQVSPEPLIKKMTDNLSPYIPSDVGKASLQKLLKQYGENTGPSMKLYDDSTKIYGPFKGKIKKNGVQVVVDKYGKEYLMNTVDLTSLETPDVPTVYTETGNLYSYINDVSPQLFAGVAQPPSASRLREMLQELRNYQDSLLGVVRKQAPEAVDNLRQVNEVFADSYSKTGTLEAFARKNTGGVNKAGRFIPKASAPNRAILKATTGEPAKLEVLLSQLPEELAQQVRTLPELEANRVIQALAEGRIPNSPKEITDLAKGVKARIVRGSGSEGFAEMMANTQPLSPVATLTKRAVAGSLGERIAKFGDGGRQSLGKELSMTQVPQSRLKSAIDIGVRGAVRGSLGESQDSFNPLPKLSQPRVRLAFNRENIPESLKSVIRMSSEEPISQDTLLSLESQHGIPEEELVRLFTDYAKGIEPE